MDIFIVDGICSPRNASSPLPYVEAGNEEKENACYTETLSNEHRNKVQQMEAENRWKQLQVMVRSYPYL